MRDLYTVGPVNMFERTLKLASNPIPYFRNAYFSDVMFDIRKNMLALLNAPEDSELLVLTMSGTGGMEASIKNLAKKESKVLVINGGTFGARFVDICQRNNVDYLECVVPFEEDLNEDMLNKYADEDIDIICINIHETSIGKLYNKQLISDFAKKKGALLVIDAISSFLADDLDMTKTGADIIITSSQKALALDAGLCLMALSSRAIDRVKEVNCRDLYMGLGSYLEDMKRGQTPFTPAVGNAILMQDRLKGIAEAGIESEIGRCKMLAEYFRKNISHLPVIIPEYTLSNCLTPIIIKDENAQELNKFLIEKYDIHITPSGGKNAGRIIRVGHIGNHDIQGLDRLIKGMEEFYRV